ncbi:unnamed protein product [Moneuplotes crassus]|uniref:Uncharacterized protein n=1 Tax=Euplotes crassus TaxID=5936 RepID=A0AAD1X770_EUPCR|nr:unnamed protein product [Moneuplotes crassus]
MLFSFVLCVIYLSFFNLILFLIIITINYFPYEHHLFINLIIPYLLEFLNMSLGFFLSFDCPLFRVYIIIWKSLLQNISEFIQISTCSLLKQSF